MLEEEMTGLLIDKKKLSYIQSRNQVVLAFNPIALKRAGFELGGDVNIIFGKNKIIITNDIREFFKNIEGLKDRKVIDDSLVNVNMNMNVNGEDGSGSVIA